MHSVRTAKPKAPTFRRWPFLAILIAMAPASAFAKDICVHELPVGVTYRFTDVKTLRPGHIIALKGARIFAPTSNAVPVDGTAIMRTDGRVIVGVLVHNMSPSLSQPSGSFIVSMDTDADLTGTGAMDTDGDFRGDFAVAWTNVDCASVAIP